MNNNDELLTMEEIVKELGKTRATIHKYMKQGMPFIKKGRNNFFNKDEVLKWYWGQQVSDDYIEQTMKAQEYYPDDPLAQMKYLRNNASKRSYAIGMAEIMQRSFQFNSETMKGEIRLSAGKFDYFTRGILFAMKQIPHSEDKDDERFFYISNRIEDFVDNVISQRHSYKYQNVPFINYFGINMMTIEEYDRRESILLGHNDPEMAFFNSVKETEK